ncbi:MAG: hypothetical protein HRT71_18015 [Flavobacteriales bacterium]|nr:hypothetical protein [Flavobacteriales bacterium]
MKNLVRFTFLVLLTISNTIYAQMGSAGMGDPGMGEPGSKIKKEHAWTIDAKKDKAGPVILVDGLMEQNVGIGVDGDGCTSKLTVNGTIESKVGGFRFPDGTVQSTASSIVFENEMPTIPSLNVIGDLKLGANSLYLGSRNTGTAGTKNYIYATKTRLHIQSQGPIGGGVVIEGDPHLQNTVINSALNTGNLGIGVSLGLPDAINAKLILSTGPSPSKDYFNIVTWSDYRKSVFIVKNNGNVGIGTANPLEALQVGDRFVLHDGGPNGSRLIADNYHHDASTGGQNIEAGYSSGICFTKLGTLCLSTSANAASGSAINWKHNIIIYPQGSTLPAGKVVFSSPLEVNHSINVNNNNLIIKDGSFVMKKLNETMFKVNENGRTWARHMTVTLNNIADYVFAPDYELNSLDYVRDFIKENSHLPGVPSQKEVNDNNNVVDLGEMQNLLLLKVEELTLYILEQNETIIAIQQELNELNSNN